MLPPNTLMEKSKPSMFLRVSAATPPAFRVAVNMLVIDPSVLFSNAWNFEPASVPNNAFARIAWSVVLSSANDCFSPIST